MAEAPLQFPKGFVWGTATASYQVEGAVHEDSRGTSIWDTFSHKAGRTRNGDTGDVACRHYERVQEDVALIKELGVGAYRFSVAWPRVQPDGKGPANQAGLDFYRRLVEALRANGISPVATLYHWDLPQALEDQGGWTERSTAERFAEYAEMVADVLGDEVGSWVTLNEPWCSAWLGYGTGVHAPGRIEPAESLRAAHHLLLAHGWAVDVLRRATKAPVGIALSLIPAIPASERNLDVSAANWVDGNHNAAYLAPLFTGAYPGNVAELFSAPGASLGFIQRGDMGEISRPLDFLGVNYYHSQVFADLTNTEAARHEGYLVAPPFPPRSGTGLPAPVRVYRPGLEHTAMGWEIDPQALGPVLLRVRDEYTKVPLYITENGVALDDYRGPDGAVHDPRRIQYLDAHLREVRRAIDRGVSVRGYFVWSLMDNFEWSEGYSKRFGLTWVEYPTGERAPKDSFFWYRQVAAANALP